VESAEQAREIVAMTRYPPRGRRGAAFGVAHDDYEAGPVAAKIAAAMARTLVIVQIETAKGAEAVNEIAAVDGVDVVWLGHFDLTDFLGIPGEFGNDRYLEQVAAIVDAAGRHGKTAGFMPVDEKWARNYLGRGFRMMAYGMDLMMLQQELARGLAVMREHATAGTASGRRARG
ncbi:MAG: aldolase/citrate lyase family protein, partial [Acetobacteraceae bacterium]